MKCPLCKLDLRIRSSYTVTEDENAVTVQELFCVNPQCQNKNARLPAKVLKHIHPKRADAAATLRLCGCGSVLADIGDETFSLPPAVEYTLADSGALTVRCPDCGESRTYTVAGRVQIPG